jgi:Lon protease-like protein
LVSAPRHAVPVFPLPGTVLFPGTTLALHVFELRYRTMVRDALSGSRMITLALLKPGWELDYHGSPEFHPLGCLARFDEVEWLPNDCYDLKVTGVSRVRFHKVVSEFPYRSARVELLPQHPYPDDDPLIQLEKRALADAFDRLLATMASESSEARVDRDVRYELLVNTICMASDLSAQERLDLLAQDSLVERGRRIRERIERRLREGTARGPEEPPAEPGAHN